MTDAKIYIVRIAVIIGGYAFACLCASVVANVAMAGLIHPFLVAIGLLVAAYFSIIPATVAILTGEILRIRGWFFYAIAGGATIALMNLWADYWREGVPPPRSAAAELILYAAGISGGIGYWAVAGRNAGMLRDAWQNRGTTQ